MRPWICQQNECYITIVTDLVVMMSFYKLNYKRYIYCGIIGGSRGHCRHAPPQWDPILSILHTIPPKAPMSELGTSPPMGWHPANGKSWIRHWVCFYRLVMISIKWSETAQKNTLARADVIVTQLLRYHMPLLYFVCNHLITSVFIHYYWAKLRKV